MRQTVRLGRLAGVDIGVHWTVLVVVLLLALGLSTNVLPIAAPGFVTLAYVSWAFVVAVLFFACLLAHELAHVLVARRFGVKAKRVTLWLLGGVSELDSDPPTPKADLLVAGAGPLTSLVLGGIGTGAAFGAGALGLPRLVVVALSWLAGVNLIIGVFNLLPGAPLDGGRILRAILWRFRGDRLKAGVAADRAGAGLGLVLAGVGLVQILFTRELTGLWLVLLGWFLITAANAESTATRLQAALAGRRVRDVMSTEPVSGYAGQSVDSFVTGVIAHSRHHVFPVLGLDGRPVGLVGRTALLRLPEEARSATSLGEVARSGGELPVVGPDDPAEAAVRALNPMRPLVPVVDGAQLVGVVTAADVAHAAELAPL